MKPISNNFFWTSMISIIVTGCAKTTKTIEFNTCPINFTIEEMDKSKTIYYESQITDITSDQDIISRSNTTVGTNWTLTYNPLILPVKIKWNPTKGLYIEHSEQQEIITPVGIIGIDYSVSTKNGQVINGYTINDGDYVIALVDRNKSQKELFKIEGYKQLKIVVVGKTIINAQSGYVEIDITDAKIGELKFIDNSRVTITNTTQDQQTIWINYETGFGIAQYACEIPPLHFETLPIDIPYDQTYFVSINSTNKNNGVITQEKLQIYGSDVCQIRADQTKNIHIHKIQSTQ